MLTTLKTAQIILRDELGACPVPLTDEPLRSVWFGAHGHVLVGATALRGIKYKKGGQWQVDDRQVRQAAKALRELPWDPDDLVDAGLASRDTGDGRNWRSTIAGWIGYAAFNAVRDKGGCGCETRPCKTGEFWLPSTGLPCGLTAEELHRRCGTSSLAGTLPLKVLRWTGKKWVAPRAYVTLLDEWQAMDQELWDKHACCERCGEHAQSWSNWFHWRGSSATGYSTLCPSCTAVRYRPYNGHLRGRTYARVKKMARADDFLCCLCAQPRRAYYWDHCHDHDFVRGPVCASCNTHEGRGLAFAFRPGAIAHLMRCPACDTARTIERRHQRALVQDELRGERHGSCSCEPWVEALTLHPQGGADATLHCYAHDTRWERHVSLADHRAIIDAYIDRALGRLASEDGPDPDIAG
ncbi:endonuclease domain-containing protein [Streptomyces sp. NPDC092952]|uniref:endonuclease domain-containing protein n=1 Tax=Streptomyces sp. NPDC092952 TaxID=3366018 RepID=UPI0037FAB499